MRTHLTSTDLGPVVLDAPASPPRHVRATHGHLWQWVGDGAELYTLSVAARPTGLGTRAGVRDHLRWELDALRPERGDPSPEAAPATEAARSSEAAEVMVMVEGAVGAAGADVLARMGGQDVLHRVVVATDGEVMQVVRVLVPDRPEGRELCERVTSSLGVRPWTVPR